MKNVYIAFNFVTNPVPVCDCLEEPAHKRVKELAMAIIDKIITLGRLAKAEPFPEPLDISDFWCSNSLMLYVHCNL